MVKAAVALAVLLVVLAIVIERQLITRAPREAERRLTAWLGVPTIVVAGGRPRDWLRHRTVPAVSLSATNLPIRDGRLKIALLEVQLQGVRLEGDRDERRIIAREGSFKATLTEEAVRGLVDLPPLVRRLDLRDDRVRLQTTAGISVDVTLRAEGGAIVLKPMGSPLDILVRLSHRIAIDDLPAGAVIERVQVRNGSLVLSGPIDGSRLSG